MIKLLDILENKILVPRRSKEERGKNYQIALQKKIQQYMKGGGKGDLNLYGAPITSLPSGLSVGGYLNLANSKITSLPSGLKVGGYLSLSGALITSLPPGLSVGGDLYLSFCKNLTSLPSGLSIGGDLSLSFCKNLTSLPSGLSVGGNLILYGTPLSESHTKEQIEQMAPGIKGNIYM